MNFPLYIAKRYIVSKSRSNAINIINWVASLGIVVSAMALFVVLSVFSGLKDFSLSFSNQTDPDLKISSILGKNFTISDLQENQIKKIEGVLFCSKVIEERVLFIFDEKQIVAVLKGIDENFIKVNDFKKTIFEGIWLKPNTYQVVVGYGIAQKFSLGLSQFSYIDVFVPRAGKGDIQNPEQAFNKVAVEPVGVYVISDDLDSKYVFCNLNLTQELLEYRPNQVSSIEIKIAPEADENKIIKDLKNIFNNSVNIKNRIQLNESLYKMLNTENTVVYLIFTLVMIIALFNLIGALIMMILDKKKNLKTLFSLGVEIIDLQKIFLFQGVLLCFIGGIVGLVLGIILVMIQQYYGLIMITPSLAYPVVFSVKNILIVLGTILILGTIASLIASSRVNKKLLQ